MVRKPVLIACGLALVVIAALVMSSRRGEGMTQLLIASHDGNLALVRAEVEHKSLVNQTSAYGWTALMFAAWKGHEEIVLYLLDAGANPNHESGGVPSAFETVAGHPPSTALREALRSGHVGIAKLLVERGARIDAEAAALAAGRNDLDFLEFLKEHGADFNAESHNAFNASPLCSAAAEGKVENLRWLLAQGGNPNRVAVGQNPLGEAAKGDHPECVRILLEAGADPNLNYGVMDENPLFESGRPDHL